MPEITGSLDHVLLTPSGRVLDHLTAWGRARGRLGETPINVHLYFVRFDHRPWAYRLELLVSDPDNLTFGEYERLRRGLWTLFSWELASRHNDSDVPWAFPSESWLEGQRFDVTHLPECSCECAVDEIGDHLPQYAKRTVPWRFVVKESGAAYFREEPAGAIA